MGQCRDYRFKMVSGFRITVEGLTLAWGRLGLIGVWASSGFVLVVVVLSLEFVRFLRQCQAGPED